MSHTSRAPALNVTIKKANNPTVTRQSLHLIDHATISFEAQNRCHEERVSSTRRQLNERW